MSALLLPVVDHDYGPPVDLAPETLVVFDPPVERIDSIDFGMVVADLHSAAGHENGVFDDWLIIRHRVAPPRAGIGTSRARRAALPGRVADPRVFPARSPAR